LAKRGSRAGATNLEGGRTNVIHLKHSDDGILWEQTPEPVVKEKAKKEQQQTLSEIRSKAASKELKDVDGLLAKITVPLNKKQIYELAKAGGHGSAYLVKKQWKDIESRLKSDGKGCFYFPHSESAKNGGKTANAQ
jgi:hypothetical protein